MNGIGVKFVSGISTDFDSMCSGGFNVCIGVGMDSLSVGVVFEGFGSLLKAKGFEGMIHTYQPILDEVSLGGPNIGNLVSIGANRYTFKPRKCDLLDMWMEISKGYCL